MISFSQMLTLFFDPRGRANREHLILAASVLLVLQIMMTYALPSAENAVLALHFPIKGLAIWIGLVALIKRLHDCGLSGWSIVAGLAGLCMWTAVVAFFALFMAGRNILVPGSVGYIVALGLIMMPVLGATLWLHLTAGEPHTNRFGDLPTAFPSRKQAQVSEAA